MIPFLPLLSALPWRAALPYAAAAVVAFGIGWKVHDWTVTAWVRADLAAEQEAHAATRADLATMRANVARLQESIAVQNAHVDRLQAEAERLTSARSTAATDALQRARQPRREAVRGVEAWNATVAD